MGAPGVTQHTVLGIDAGSVSLREADHLLHHLVDRLGLPAGTVGCTHLIRTGRPHAAISLALADPEAADPTWERLTALLTAPDQPPTGAALGNLQHGPSHLAHGAALATTEHTDRTAGRAVVYPGVEHLTGTVTVGEVLARSAITRIAVLGSPPGPDAAARIATRDHVRPEWRGGELTLTLVPAAGGLLAPFEVPNPTSCCSYHG
jgi:hypothetical protein